MVQDEDGQLETASSEIICAKKQATEPYIGLPVSPLLVIKEHYFHFGCIPRYYASTRGIYAAMRLLLLTRWVRKCLLHFMMDFAPRIALIDASNCAILGLSYDVSSHPLK